MSILEQVKVALSNADVDPENQMGAALVDAERMSDQFSEVKPVPYIIPIERFVGMAVFNGSKPLT
jgi:hypothetical protein